MTKIINLRLYCILSLLFSIVCNPFVGMAIDTPVIKSGIAKLTGTITVQNKTGGDSIYVKITVPHPISGEFAKYTARLASNKDFDVIHCHDWMTFLAGIEIKALTGKPLVLHVHALEYDRSGPESKSFVYELERWAMHYADAVIPVSNYTGVPSINIPVLDASGRNLQASVTLSYHASGIKTQQMEYLGWLRLGIVCWWCYYSYYLWFVR